MFYKDADFDVREHLGSGNNRGIYSGFSGTYSDMQTKIAISVS